MYQITFKIKVSFHIEIVESNGGWVIICVNKNQTPNVKDLTLFHPSLTLLNKNIQRIGIFYFQWNAVPNDSPRI